MEPQTSLKIIGKNTEYTQNNHKDLDKIIEDPYRSLVRLIKIHKDLHESLARFLRILKDIGKILEDL